MIYILTIGIPGIFIHGPIVYYIALVLKIIVIKTYYHIHTAPVSMYIMHEY